MAAFVMSTKNGLSSTGTTNAILVFLFSGVEDELKYRLQTKKAATATVATTTIAITVLLFFTLFNLHKPSHLKSRYYNRISTINSGPRGLVDMPWQLYGPENCRVVPQHRPCTTHRSALGPCSVLKNKQVTVPRRCN